MRYLGVICVLFSFSISGWSLDIQGHRGARWSRPENTLPAFQFAIESGVNTLEMDTLVTRDNEVVVTHDPTLNPELCRTKKGEAIKSGIAIRSLSYEELKKFDCASTKNLKFPEQVALENISIPRLSEVLDLVKASKRTVRLNIETKINPAEPELAPQPEEFVRLLDSVIRKSGLQKRVILQSFDPRTLQAAVKLKLPYELSLLLADRPNPPLNETAKLFSAKIISPDYHWITEEDVRRLHSAGIKIIPWTVNEKKDWKRLIELGVDGIITDNPKALVDFIKQEKLKTGV
jgi:glycerophosphoryl diester phosphodiesterase